MTRPSAKVAEMDSVRAMVDLMPELGVVAGPIDRESPDAELRLADGRRVGIEVVRAIDECVARGAGTARRIQRDGVAALVAAGVRAQVVVHVPEGTAAVLGALPMRDKYRAEIAALARLAQAALGEAPMPGSVWRRYDWFDDIVDDGEVC